MVRLILLTGLLAASVWAADHTVCAAGCDFNTMQAAIDHVSRGDTISLIAGTTFVSTQFHLDDKPGAEWVTIRSSKADLLPEGYRPAITDTRLATISFSYTSGTNIGFNADPAFSSNCWSSQTVGNVVTFGYLHGGGLTCEARLYNESLLTSTSPICTVTLLGNAVATAGTSGSQGDGLRVGIGTDGKCHIAHKSDIAETTQFTCTNCVGTGEVESWTHFNFPDNTVPLGTVGYSVAGAVTGVSDKRVWFSGPQARRTDMMGLYAGTWANTYKGPPLGTHHYRFVGIHFRAEQMGAYFGSMILKDSGRDYRYVPHHIEVDRCVFSQPKASLYFWRWFGLYHSENILIKDTRFLNSQTLPESQMIFMSGSEGPLYLDNIEIDGGTENIMFGGSDQKVVGVPALTMKRSLMRKRMEQWPNLQLVRDTSTDVLALVVRATTTRCNAGTCVGYYEDTPYTFPLDSTITLAGGAAAKLYIGMSSTGLLTVGHNSGASVTCAGNFTCLAGITSRTGMAEYAMIYEWTGAAGVWNASYDWGIFDSSGTDASFLHKNLFEMKIGKNLLIEGNLFRNYWAAGGQSTAFLIGPRNQNGQDVSARMDGMTVTRNKFSGLHSATSFWALDDMGRNTMGRRFALTHNIMVDVNRTRWNNYTAGGQGISGGSDALANVAVWHNTIEADRDLFHMENSGTLFNTFVFWNNLWLWNGSSAYGVGGRGLSSGFNCIRKSDWVIVPTYGYIGPTSEYRGNLNLTTNAVTNAVCGSTRGWGNPIWTDVSANNYTNNDGEASIAFTDYITSISSPATYTDNMRIKTTSTKSVQNAGYDGPATSTGMDAGADVDWVETLTAGVNEGIPPTARLKSVKIDRTGTTATVSLACPGETVTVTVAGHQRMKTADEVYTSTVACGSARQTFSVAGMTAGVPYWLKISATGWVVKEPI